MLRIDQNEGGRAKKYTGAKAPRKQLATKAARKVAPVHKMQSR